jgi:autotransporter-associated beta strand protein
LPSDTTNVFFAATGALAVDLATTLDQSFTINSLNFTAATGNSPIGISPGTAPSSVLTLLAANVNGNTGNRGITVASGATSPITLSTDIALGGDQTWHNDGAAGLVVSGSKITGSNMQLTIEGTGDTTIGAALQLTRDVGATDQLIKAGSGKLTLTAPNTYSIPTTINGGILEIAGAGTLGTGDSIVTLAAGATLQFNQSTSLEVGNLIRSDAGDHGLIKQIGTGTTVLTNDNLQYGGAVVVTNGTLVSAAAGNIGPLYAASSITVGGSGGDSARLVASGTLSEVTIGDQGTFSPGASAAANHETVGWVEAGSVTLAAGSTFTFQFLGGLPAYDSENGTEDPSGIVDADDASYQLANGAGTAWDLLYASSLNLHVGTSGKIDLKLVSMSDPSTPGISAGGFGSVALDPDPQLGSPETLHWLFASTSAVTLNGVGITGDINDYFQIDSSSVQSSSGVDFNGSFYVSLVGNDLYLNYSAVPEPGSLLLIGIAAAGLGLNRYRRRKGCRCLQEMEATIPNVA